MWALRPKYPGPCPDSPDDRCQLGWIWDPGVCGLSPTPESGSSSSKNSIAFSKAPGSKTTNCWPEASLGAGRERGLQGFRGPMARATWASQPLHGSRWELEYPYCHQMNTQTQGATEGFWKKSNFRKFSAEACQPENGRVLTGKGSEGEGGVTRRPPPLVRGHEQGKGCSGPGSKLTHSSYRPTQVLTPPPHPHPPKSGTQERHDRGVKLYCLRQGTLKRGALPKAGKGQPFLSC